MTFGRSFFISFSSPWQQPPARWIPPEAPGSARADYLPRSSGRGLPFLSAGPDVSELRQMDKALQQSSGSGKTLLALFHTYLAALYLKGSPKSYAWPNRPFRRIPGTSRPFCSWWALSLHQPAGKGHSDLPDHPADRPRSQEASLPGNLNAETKNYEQAVANQDPSGGRPNL
jgi:hypothetical protein